MLHFSVLGFLRRREGRPTDMLARDPLRTPARAGSGSGDLASAWTPRCAIVGQSDTLRGTPFRDDMGVNLIASFGIPSGNVGPGLKRMSLR
jgi:hypothetical protein